MKSTSRTNGLQRIGTNLGWHQFDEIVRQLYCTRLHFLKSRSGDWAGNYKCLEDALLFNNSCQHALDRWYDALGNSEYSFCFIFRKDGKVLESNGRNGQVSNRIIRKSCTKVSPSQVSMSPSTFRTWTKASYKKEHYQAFVQFN